MSHRHSRLTERDAASERLSVRVSRARRDAIDALVETGPYANRSEVLRDAIDRLAQEGDVDE